MSKKTGAGLVAYAQAQLGLPYWMGTFGQTATAALYAYNKARLPQYYTASDFPSQYGKRVHDCVGLIKGYLWSATPTAVPVYNASQDVNAAGLYARCSKRGGISSMPEVPGVCVFMSGLDHVGVYVGGGWVIEARGHAYGVVKTKLSARGWTLWGMPDWIEYDEAKEELDQDEAYKRFLELMARYMSEPDASPPSAWAESACNKAVEKGIVKGDGTAYNWGKPLSREEYIVLQDREGLI